MNTLKNPLKLVHKGKGEIFIFNEEINQGEEFVSLKVANDLYRALVTAKETIDTLYRKHQNPPVSFHLDVKLYQMGKAIVNAQK